MFKNEALMANTRAGRNASIGGIDGIQTTMPAITICVIPYVRGGSLNGNAAIKIET